jgi:hypothetical protein
MQKVEGSSPFSRFQENPAQAGFLIPETGENQILDARVKPRVKILQTTGA